ncbi:unnamed protein product [Cuscuta epithymum]|uniref:Uncharacterized protein n=1 Tax=Cuscuta epithymum TaxID=186058 RepID=A0AAV0C8G2_9ASTE|nr:unnamed protein product [Cuscuta epithymum]
MQYDRPLSAIVPGSRSARPSLPGWRRTSHASRSAPQRHRVQIRGSDHPSPPGWRRPSYAVRSAPQCHRTQLTFSSSIPSRMATNVLCITVGPSAPSCPDSRFGSSIPPGWRRTSYASRSAPQRHRVLIHGSDRPSLQDGDDRLMQYDRPLSAIVPGSRSARPSLPGWRRTSYASRSAPQRHRVQIRGSDHPSPPGWRRPSYAVRSAPQCHRTQLTFSSSIPSRMATNVLCITIGPSAPSCPDSRFGSSIPPGWRRTSYASRSAPQRHRVQIHGSARPFPSRMVTNVFMQHDRPLSAIVSGSCSARPSLPGWRRTSLMQHNRPRRAIVSGSSPDCPSLLGWRRPSYAARLPLGADMPGFSMRATAFYHISHSFSHTLHPYITCIHAFMHHTSYIHTYTRASCFDSTATSVYRCMDLKLLRLESSSQSALLPPDAFRGSVPVEEHPSPDPVGKGGASRVDYVQECGHPLIYYDYSKTQVPARQRQSAGKNILSRADSRTHYSRNWGTCVGIYYPGLLLFRSPRHYPVRSPSR